jgi:hypothetical protein
MRILAIVFAAVCLLALPARAATLVNGDFSDGLTGWTGNGWSVGGPGTGVSAADLGLSLPPGNVNFAYTSCSDAPCTLSQTFTVPEADFLYQYRMIYSYSGATSFSFGAGTAGIRNWPGSSGCCWDGGTEHTFTVTVFQISGYFAVADFRAELSNHPAVPEPSTWGMLLIGFASVGFVVNHRRKGTVRAA